MLPKILMSMVLAAIIELILLNAIVKIFEWRFLSKADSICMLYECIYPMMEDDFNNDKSMKVFVKFEHGKCKIKFHNAIEAGLKFQILVRRAFRSYKIVEFVMNIVGNDLVGSEMEAAKKDLDRICCDIRNLMNKAQEKNN